MEIKKLIVTPLNEKQDEDFHLWCLGVMSYLEGKELAEIVPGELYVKPTIEGQLESAVYKNFLRDRKRAREIIVSALGDRPLRAIFLPMGGKIWEINSSNATQAVRIIEKSAP